MFNNNVFKTHAEPNLLIRPSQVAEVAALAGVSANAMTDLLQDFGWVLVPEHYIVNKHKPGRHVRESPNA